MAAEFELSSKQRWEVCNFGEPAVIFSQSADCTKSILLTFVRMIIGQNDFQIYMPMLLFTL